MKTIILIIALAIPLGAQNLLLFADEGDQNVVVDGGFDTACGVVWICGTNWTIPANALHGTAATSSSRQENILITGVTYTVAYTIKNFVGGSVRLVVGGTNASLRVGDGTFVESVLCGATAHLYFDGVGAFTGDIDDVSAVPE